MSTMHTDTLFAPVDTDLHLERIAGGNENQAINKSLLTCHILH